MFLNASRKHVNSTARISHRMLTPVAAMGPFGEALTLLLPPARCGLHVSASLKNVQMTDSVMDLSFAAVRAEARKCALSATQLIRKP